MTAKAMVCRCEDVTLDEVEEAIGKGQHDLESVKRYTGLGTGWCQGKQCVVACARLLAAKTGAQPELPITARPPLHPIPLGALASLGGDDDA
jgi:NAD(P)H-nitrite reductase large subunit